MNDMKKKISAVKLNKESKSYEVKTLYCPCSCTCVGKGAQELVNGNMVPIYLGNGY